MCVCVCVWIIIIIILLLLLFLRKTLILFFRWKANVRSCKDGVYNKSYDVVVTCDNICTV